VVTSVAVMVALPAAAASAAGPDHFTIGGSFGPDLALAGTVCDFTYSQEGSFTGNVKLFRDAQGNPIRRVTTFDQTLVHRNVDTGRALTERIHFVVNTDFATGTQVFTGQTWHLRDVGGGKVVVAGAGLFELVQSTGEFLRFTPNTRTDFAGTICPALGGAPA
jgi:hypothetical protein